MSSTQKSYSSLLSVDDIMETAFLISSANYSPSNSCFLEMKSIPKPDSASTTQDVEGGLVALKTTESSLNNEKGDLQVSYDGTTSFCETPLQLCTFDMSISSSANNSTTNSMGDAFCDTKSSTPCKAEKLSKLAETVLKSSKRNDLLFFKKPPTPPVWEISRIQATQDKTLSLGASVEEFGSLVAVKPNTPSLEESHAAVPLTNGGVGTAKLPVLPL